MRSIFQVMTIGAITLISTLPIQAAEPEPAGANHQPELGWGLWRPMSVIPSGGFTAGFSNLELGGFNDFESACAQTLGTPASATPYWFRLSNKEMHYGTSNRSVTNRTSRTQPQRLLVVIR